MDFQLNDTNCIKFRIILDYLSRNDKLTISKINKSYQKYLVKYQLLLHIHDFFWLIKRQRRRPVVPNLYSRLCGIDLFSSVKHPHPIMAKYKKSRILINNLVKSQYPLKYNYKINNCIYMFDTLLLIDCDIEKVIDLIKSGFTPKSYKTLSYYTQLFNYRSLGVSYTKAHMLSIFNHDFNFHSDNFENPYVLMDIEWNQYTKWKKLNKKYLI